MITSISRKLLITILLITACDSTETKDDSIVDDSTVVDEATSIEESLIGREEELSSQPLLAITSTPAERGEIAWRNICAACHVSIKGFDLAHFNYPDSVIFRRSLFHNDSATAFDIIAHVRSLAQNDTMTPKRAPFQPGNIVLASDQEFGIRLFGSDQWPANLTRSQLLAQNPLLIPVPLPLMVWSDETRTYDWLAGIPQDALPFGVRAAINNSIVAYMNNPSMTTASILVRRARTAAHDLNIPDAPCRYPTDVNNYDAKRCTDVGKWGAVLLYTEGLRQNNLHGIAAQAADQWWETGHDFHKAQQHKKPLPERDLNIAGWMHVSWIFNPSMNKASTYETGPLAKLGLRRMANWVSLRSQVARKPDSLHACGDVYGAAINGSPIWQLNAITFGYRELQYRKKNGLLDLSRSQNTTCIDYINKTQQRLTLANRAALKPLADSTIIIISQ